MRLTISPNPDFALLDMELDLVIALYEERSPEIFLQSGTPRPDRHFLLGMAQTIVVAVEESDKDSVLFLESGAAELQDSGELRTLHSSLLIVRSIEGRFSAIVFGDPRQARRLARRAERWFTGTVRLDIP
ncbi:hypothetical protein [Desulfomonile tiedjei]|uniref:Uncharacterized protein n=1 Tax=Desulfomonile tiedjei (strain ATCC 49306 / DSM 6799 / DCB-1) TaxID=706587 RepID=I4C6Q1_DESTA|nr:hypothetical protein [Desulfomonile tiedjei]AFM25242.1 hypothetical protein Desti_2562 [Desulfomonile tiedjei DSM 6799]